MKNAFVHSFTKLKAKQQIKKKIWMHFTLRSNLRTECVEISGNIWKYLEISGNIWKCVEISGNFVFQENIKRFSWEKCSKICNLKIAKYLRENCRKILPNETIKILPSEMGAMNLRNCFSLTQLLLHLIFLTISS